MNIKSERGQAEIAIVLLLAVVAIGFLFFSMSANQRSMQQGAEVIGEAVGDTIDNITAEDLAVGWWVNQQKLMPNQHAVEIHGADAWLTTDCYNRNGTFRIYRVGNQEFHFLCRDDDGSIRDIMFERETNTSNRFHMKNAFTPQDYGIEKDVLRWLTKNKNAQQASVPNDIIIYIDGIAP